MNWIRWGFLLLVLAAGPGFSEDGPRASLLNRLGFGAQEAEDVSAEWLLQNEEILRAFFDGEYVFQGDEKRQVLYFPTTEREVSDSGFQNHVRPPTPIYVKIPRGTTVRIRAAGGALVFQHTALEGAYAPGQLGQVVESPLALAPQSKHESLVFDRARSRFTLTIKQGVKFIAGRKSVTHITRTPDGDLLVESTITGWAPLPTPKPVTWNEAFQLTRAAAR
jgi:hypothetical protein